MDGGAGTVVVSTIATNAGTLDGAEQGTDGKHHWGRWGGDEIRRRKGLLLTIHNSGAAGPAESALRDIDVGWALDL
jgi:hypothetical protein